MTRDTRLAILATHFQRYRNLELRDVYKLLYQRVFGPEHSIDNLRAARERLYLEVILLPETPAAIPMIEPLSSALCRVNLQPFIQAGGNIGHLWKVFRQTGRDFQPGSPVDFQRDWKLFRNSAWVRRYDDALLDQFWQRMATADFPAVHHSRRYSKAYAPHYRVVCRSLAEAMPGVS